MSKESERLVAILDERGLLHAEKTPGRVSSYEKSDLEGLNQDYQQWSNDSLQPLLSEIWTSNKVSVLPSVRYRQSDELRWLSRAALYVDTVFVNDGLEVLDGLKMGVTPGYFRQDLPRILGRIGQLKDLAKTGFLEFLPPSVGATVSSNHVSDTVSEALMRPEVQALIRSRTQATVYNTGHKVVQIGPYGSVGVRFNVQPHSVSSVQILPLPPGPPVSLPIDVALEDPDLRTGYEGLSRSLLGTVATDQRTARALGAWYLSPAGIEWELITLDNKTAGQTATAKALAAVFDMKLPYVDSLTPDQVLRVRRESPESFENFRTSLCAAMNEVASTPGTNEFVREVNDIRTQILDPAVAQVNADAAVLRRQVLKRLAIDVPLVIGSTALAAFSPAILQAAAGTLIGSLSAVDLVKEAGGHLAELEGLKRNPYHFAFRLHQQGTV